MSFKLSDTIEIEMAFIEKRNRNTSKFECYVEVTVSPDASTPCQIVYPLGKDWESVKKVYPNFEDVMTQLHRLDEISREFDDIRILKLEGDEGLYDQNIDEWNSILKGNN